MNDNKTFHEQFQDALNDSPAKAYQRGRNDALDAVLEMIQKEKGFSLLETDIEVMEYLHTKIEQLRAEKDDGK